MKSSLSAQEAKRYAACKQQITDGLQTCFDTGVALIEIRDGKLYRDEFDTFGDFCQQAYQIGRSYAYRLIESAEIKMSPIGDKIQNEAQARALASVPEPLRPKVIKLAEKSGDLTAAAISVAAEKVEKQTPPPPNKSEIKEAVQLDRTGLPIPSGCVALWNRAGEVQKFLTQIGDMRGTLRTAQEDKDLLWGGLSYSAALAELGKVYTTLECAKPYAVCPKCQGKLPKTCTCCNGRGLISQYKWDTAITREEKKMRAMVVDKLKAA